MSRTKEALYEQEKVRNEEQDLNARSGMWEILKEFPPSTQNNSRQIVRHKLKSMQDYPSTRKQQELENMGIVTDYQDSDVGEPPNNLK